jgi:hypothetical protein
MITQILNGTPKRVFAVFFVLTWYGSPWSKTREFSKLKVLMPPDIMFILSPGGVLASFGAGPAGLLSWAAGFMAVGRDQQFVHAPAGVRYDRETSRFHLPGSWVPLTFMMVIFFAKYVFGATTALNPDAAGSTVFVMLLSVTFGGLSGAFRARFARIRSHRSDLVTTVERANIEAMGTPT